MIIFNLRKRPLLLLSLLGFELCNYIFILQFQLYCRARPFVFVVRCCVSDYCYLSFDPFFSIVDFFESYAMREIEGLSLFSQGFVFSSPRFAPLRSAPLRSALRFVLQELAFF